jgi:hypothetical protein
MVREFRVWLAWFALRTTVIAQFASSYPMAALIVWATQSLPAVGN